MHEALSIYIQVCKVYISIYIQVYIIAVRFPTIESAQLVELIQTVMDEKITLCEYTTQSFMFYIFVRYTFLFYLKLVTECMYVSSTNWALWIAGNRTIIIYIYIYIYIYIIRNILYSAHDFTDCFNVKDSGMGNGNCGIFKVLLLLLNKENCISSSSNSTYW